ncbi:hypothetical protein G6F40_014202 [Rhizopus arrhizus]|nr:hypothetical protein G6F40_014202 [Rhizopus arrhizus]
MSAAEACLGSAGLPSGRLRIDMPSSFGRLVVLPVLLRLCRQYPDLQLTMTFTDHFVDPVEEGIDLLIRFGGLHQAALDDALVEIGDGIAGQRLAADDHLEPVVLGRVVAAGDRHAGAGTQMEGGVPARRRPSARPAASSGPDRRPSRPITTSRRPCSSAAVPMAWPISAAVFGVSSLPTTPRMS